MVNRLSPGCGCCDGVDCELCDGSTLGPIQGPITETVVTVEISNFNDDRSLTRIGGAGANPIEVEMHHSAFNGTYVFNFDVEDECTPLFFHGEIKYSDTGQATYTNLESPSFFCTVDERLKIEVQRNVFGGQRVYVILERTEPCDEILAIGLGATINPRIFRFNESEPLDNSLTWFEFLHACDDETRVSANKWVHEGTLPFHYFDADSELQKLFDVGVKCTIEYL